MGELASGLFVPTIPKFGHGGLAWTVALMGGVGGTVTVLCYGYWIREEGRTSTADLKTCRIDLVTGYGMTALFGIAMVVIGSQVQSGERGAKLVVDIAQVLQARLGNWGTTMRWAFLIGAWGAVFSSLLGVWQSVPYLFADLWSMPQSHEGKNRPLPSRYPIASLPGILVVSGNSADHWLDARRFQDRATGERDRGGDVYSDVGRRAPLAQRTVEMGRHEAPQFMADDLAAVGALLFFLVAGWFAVKNQFFSG